MILKEKEESVYLDANIIVNCLLDDEYLQLLKTLKNKYNLVFFITHFVIYEVAFTMLKYRVAEYLIKEKNVSLTEIIHKWRFPHSLYEKVEDKIISEIYDRILNTLFKTFKELKVLIPKYEKESWNEMLTYLFPQFPYYGIHMEDAIHLVIAIYYKINYFLTTDSEVIANRKQLKERFGIVILDGYKDKIKRYIDRGLISK